MKKMNRLGRNSSQCYSMHFISILIYEKKFMKVSGLIHKVSIGRIIYLNVFKGI
jgi:hypothetical protein